MLDKLIVRIVRKYLAFSGLNLAKMLNCKLQCLYLSTPRSLRLFLFVLNSNEMTTFYSMSLYMIPIG